MNKISRYILVLITIMAMAVALPKFYWLAFEKPVRTPFIMYSSSEKDFIILRRENEIIRTDTKGNSYTREEYEQKLPLFYARQLLISGAMPDSVNGVAMDIHEINHFRSHFRFKPREMKKPEPGLYPLFEAESGRANLEMPSDFFRISDRMEFVDAVSNTIDEKKTQMFTTVLNNRAFHFPAKKIAGIPTTRKSVEEGYIIVDAKDEMYHVKMIKGKPYVKKFAVPDGLIFKHISCVDFSDKKYYCYLISNENELYILTQDDYRFIQLPFEGFDPDQDELRIYGNMFNYTMTAKREGQIKAVALNSNYEKVDEYIETWTKREETKQGKAANILFPVQLSLSSKNNSYINLYPTWPKSYGWIILNLLFVVVQVVIIRRSHLKPGKNIIDLAIVAVSGIFGFIAVNFFQNKFFD